MKYLILLFFTCYSLNLAAQGKYLTKNGTINFEASVPSFEEVKAKNESVTAILNTANGEFAALALVKGFRFKVALMEEHFNENYIESDQFPKATFKGKLENFDFSNLQQEYIINGSITLHGKTKKVNTVVFLDKKEDVLVFKADLKVKPADFDIEIPSVVSKKIAEDIDISVIFELNKK